MNQAELNAIQAQYDLAKVDVCNAWVRVEADRDKWKAKCEALERAIKSSDDCGEERFACFLCINYDDRHYSLKPCKDCDDNYSCWEFDEARFVEDTQ